MMLLSEQGERERIISQKQMKSLLEKNSLQTIQVSEALWGSLSLGGGPSKKLQQLSPENSPKPSLSLSTYTHKHLYLLLK